MKDTTLLIGRHGNTFAPGDVITRVGGRTDLPLVESGLLQGLALGEDLKKRNLIPTKIFTTTLQRTIQTAEQVKKALGMDIPTVQLDIFNEIDYGQDENRPEEEVVARIGADALKAWEEQAVPPPGWHVDPVGLRAAWYDFADRVAHEHAGEIVLNLTHNGIARFASVLTGDTHGLVGQSQGNLKLSTGAYGHFVHEGSLWKCLEWNIKPEMPKSPTAKNVNTPSAFKL